MTTTCLQCGAILPSSSRACGFCDSILPTLGSGHPSAPICADAGPPGSKAQGLPWLGELEHRLDAYRARRGGIIPRAAQTQLPFGEPEQVLEVATAVTEPPTPETADEDFSFTIAIGRCTPPPEKRDGRLEIDVSVPPSESNESEIGKSRSKHYGLYPVASFEERRWSAVIDGACLLFAYGGFLALFGSLGGQFTLSKLSAEVYAAALAIVYFQYFALFTVFGGTTPGMMFRGLQVSSFSGEAPTPKQMLLRSLGYLISAATLFMGFVWAWWDEDALTWHDRISHTYLTSPEARADLHSATAAHTR